MCIILCVWSCLWFPKAWSKPCFLMTLAFLNGLWGGNTYVYNYLCLFIFLCVWPCPKAWSTPCFLWTLALPDVHLRWGYICLEFSFFVYLFVCIAMSEGMIIDLLRIDTGSFECPLEVCLCRYMWIRWLDWCIPYPFAYGYVYSCIWVCIWVCIHVHMGMCMCKWVFVCAGNQTMPEGMINALLSVDVGASKGPSWDGQIFLWGHFLVSFLLVFFYVYIHARRHNSCLCSVLRFFPFEVVVHFFFFPFSLLPSFFLQVEWIMWPCPKEIWMLHIDTTSSECLMRWRMSFPFFSFIHSIFWLFINWSILP